MPCRGRCCLAPFVGSHQPSIVPLPGFQQTNRAPHHLLRNYPPDLPTSPSTTRATPASPQHHSILSFPCPMFRNTRQRLFLWSPFVPSTNPTFCVMLWTLLERHLRDQLPLIGPAVDQARSEIAFPRPIGPTKQGRPHPGLAWIWQQPQSVSPLKGLASLPLPTRCLWPLVFTLSTHPPARAWPRCRPGGFNAWEERL